jgi:hypothetical protein
VFGLVGVQVHGVSRLQVGGDVVLHELQLGLADATRQPLALHLSYKGKADYNESNTRLWAPPADPAYATLRRTSTECDDRPLHSLYKPVIVQICLSVRYLSACTVQ